VIEDSWFILEESKGQRYIKWIKNGKVFCIREPGGWIEFKVNEKIPGEIVKIKNLAKIK